MNGKKYQRGGRGWAKEGSEQNRPNSNPSSKCTHALNNPWVLRIHPFIHTLSFSGGKKRSNERGKTRWMKSYFYPKERVTIPWLFALLLCSSSTGILPPFLGFGRLNVFTEPQFLLLIIDRVEATFPCFVDTDRFVFNLLNCSSDQTNTKGIQGNCIRLLLCACVLQRAH